MDLTIDFSCKKKESIDLKIGQEIILSEEQKKRKEKLIEPLEYHQMYVQWES